MEPIETVLVTKLANALEQTYPKLTRREAVIPSVKGKVHAIIGMRRAGKTSYLFQCLQDRLDAGQDRSRLLYLNFEDERLTDLEATQLNTLIDEYYRLYPEFRGKETVTVCFDEIQLVAGWEKFVRRIIDEEKVEIFISGSSAKMLSREVATAMRGRALETWITPFSFTEYLAHHQISMPRSTSVMSSAGVSKMLHCFDQYLTIGGFPEVQNTDVRGRVQMLQGYVDSVLLRDVIERHGLANITALRALTRQLLGNTATSFSISKIYHDFRSRGISVSKETLLDYLHHLEDSFLVMPVEIYAKSARRRQVNPRKIYLADHALGMAYAVGRAPETGHYLENIIACELFRNQHSVHYYKTQSGFEIDFFTIAYDGKAAFTQIAARVDGQATLEREIRALEEASYEVPEASLLLITLTETKTIELRDRKSVSVLPAWKWLLKHAGNKSSIR